ncbi:TPA: hypothetical protein BOS_23505 [Bos taurus]|nr:TPA: hypothetical protein BOS_23505 [Bos taurus]
MPGLVENESGGKGRVCGGYKAPTNSLGAPPLVIGSRSQSFDSALLQPARASLQRFSLGLLYVGAFRTPHCPHSPGAGAGTRRSVPPRARGVAEPRRKGRIGRGVWDGAGRAALEALTRRVPGLVETAWVPLRLHPSSCRYHLSF